MAKSRRRRKSRAGGIVLVLLVLIILGFGGWKIYRIIGPNTEKADIADVVIRMINNSKTYKTAEEVVEDMPKLKALHDKFNLEIVK